MEENRTNLLKGLKLLLIIQIISITYSALAKVVNFGEWNDWLNLVLNVGVFYCLLTLRREQKFYTVAAAILGINLILTALQMIFYSHTVMQWAYDYFGDGMFQILYWYVRVQSVVLPLCAFGAMIFEYIANRCLVKQSSRKLSKCWLWLIIATSVLFAVMAALTLVLIWALGNKTVNIPLYQLIQPYLILPGLVLRVLYVVYLFQTERVLRMDEVGAQ